MPAKNVDEIDSNEDQTALALIEKGKKLPVFFNSKI